MVSGFGVMSETDGVTTSDAETQETDYIPNESDFLIGYSTVPGYVSWRNALGSLYIRKLTILLERYANR
jgi:hypothetical protein